MLILCVVAPEDDASFMFMHLDNHFPELYIANRHQINHGDVFLAFRLIDEDVFLNHSREIPGASTKKSVAFISDSFDSFGAGPCLVPIQELCYCSWYSGYMCTRN